MTRTLFIFLFVLIGMCVLGKLAKWIASASWGWRLWYCWGGAIVFYLTTGFVLFTVLCVADVWCLRYGSWVLGLL